MKVSIRDIHIIYFQILLISPDMEFVSLFQICVIKIYKYDQNDQYDQISQVSNVAPLILFRRNTNADVTSIEFVTF